MTCFRQHSLRRATLLGLVLPLLALLMVSLIPAPAHAAPGDPAGDKTGLARDVVGATPNAPTADDLKAGGKTEPLAAKLAEIEGQNRIAINLVWVLVAGFLVMFMQVGFAMVETGFTRAKNAAHTIFMNFGVYPLGMFGFWLVGFGLMFGAMGVASIGGTPTLSADHEVSITLFGKTMGLFSHNGFMLLGNYDVGVYALFLFQMVFMDTAVTIPTGAMAERWKTSAFIVYAFFMSCLLYPMFGNWAWGGGWLSQLGVNFGLGNGYVDFAGSGVVHAIGGLCGLAGAMVLGARIGKYNKDGSVSPIPGHHIPMAIIGTLILAFGWFGFNPGSTLAASGGGALRIGIVATVTMLAGTAGALTSWIYMQMRYGKPDPTMICNGLLAGLVAITAPSGFVNATDAMIIGGIAGVLVCLSISFWDKLRIDDPVGAISVHGVCGIWGVLAVGLFADGTWAGSSGWNGVAGRAVTGLFHGGGMSQLMAQLVGCATLVVWAFGLSFIFFKIQNKVQGMRVSPEVEMQGLDLPELGVLAYPAFAMDHGATGEGSHISVPSMERPRPVEPVRKG